jgi:hypothetical protein
VDKLEMSNRHNIFVGKSEGKGLNGKLRRNCEDNIKVNVYTNVG